MYQVLVFIHIVCAIIWVGGAFFSQMLALQVRRSDDPMELPRLGRRLEFMGGRIFLPAAVVLFVAGVLMVIQAWSFGQLWVGASTALWVLSAVIGAAYLGPNSVKVAELFEREGPTSVAALARMDRILLVSRLELVSFAVIVAMMVFKPGAGVG